MREFGHRWAKIKERLPSRTEHAIRNRWRREIEPRLSSKIEPRLSRDELTQLIASLPLAGLKTPHTKIVQGGGTHPPTPSERLICFSL